MLAYLLIILGALWMLGVVRIPALSLINIHILYIAGRAVGLIDLLKFILILWLIRILPSPIREIVSVILVIWLLSFFGVLFLGGLANLIVLFLILGLIIHLFGYF